MHSRRNFLKISLLLSPILALPKLIFGRTNKEPLNILIIGDSISIGYTPLVKELLKEKAQVTRPYKLDGKPENCQGTTYGIKHIDRWIGDTKWDVIHFNFGLHDIKHVDPETGKNSTNPDHPQQADLKQYKKNLKTIVKKLKASGAKLIFATTTPYPDKTSGPLRKPGMPEKYNKVALKIMRKNKIAVNDLYALVLPQMEKIQRANNVHFTPKGSQTLAEQVSNRITEIIK